MQSIDQSLVGTTIEDCFRIDRFLGTGAMGSAFQATQLDLRRQVCIKFLKLDALAELENLERFKREAKVLARMHHPNIVVCYSFGLFRQTFPYLVMEFVDGHSLKAEVLKGAINWQEACRIAGQLSAALHYAHRDGFIHRDVKPENVLLTRDGEVKVVDFGLVGKDSSAGGMVTLTSPGSLIGTVNYMAPEAFRGAVADKSLDIYAVGCVLFEMLTGQLPFDADNPIAVIHAHTTARLPRLPNKVATDPVRRNLEKIIWTATAKNPEDRFKTCDEMAAELAELLDHPAETGTTNDAALPDKEPVSIRPLGIRRMCSAMAFAFSLLLIAAVIGQWSVRSRAMRTKNGTAPVSMTARVVKPQNELTKEYERFVRRLSELNGEAARKNSCDRAFINDLWMQSAEFHKFICQYGFDLTRESERLLTFSTAITPNLSHLASWSRKNSEVELARALTDNQIELLLCFGYVDAAFRTLTEQDYVPAWPLRRVTSEQCDQLHTRFSEVISKSSSNEAARIVRLMRPLISYYSSFNKLSLITDYVRGFAGRGCTDEWTPSLLQVASSSSNAGANWILGAVAAANANHESPSDCLSVLKRHLSQSDAPDLELVSRLMQIAGYRDESLAVLHKGQSQASRRGDGNLWCHLKLREIANDSEAGRLDSALKALQELVSSREWQKLITAPVTNEAQQFERGSLELLVGNEYSRCNHVDDALHWLTLAEKDSRGIPRLRSDYWLNMECSIALASMLWNSGSRVKAMRLAEDALHSMAGSTDVTGMDYRNKWLRFFLERQEVSEAEKLAPRLLHELEATRRFDQARHTRAQLAIALQLNGIYRKAFPYWQQVLQYDSKNTIDLTEHSIAAGFSGVTYRVLKEFDQSIAVQKQALNALLRPDYHWTDRTYTSFQRCINELCTASVRTGRTRECQMYLKERFEPLSKDPKIALTYFMYSAELACCDGRFIEARRFCNRALQTITRRKLQSDFYYYLPRIAEIEFALGNIDRCNAQWQRTVPWYGALNPATGAYSLRCNGDVCLLAGEPQKARELYASARKMAPARSAEWVASAQRLARACIDGGDDDAARAVLDETLPAVTATEDENTRLLETELLLDGYGRLYERSKDNRAIETMRKSLKTFERLHFVGGVDCIRLFQSSRTLAALLTAAGQLDEAQSVLISAVTRLQTTPVDTMGRSNFYRSELLRSLAQLYLKAEKGALAEKSAQEALALCRPAEKPICLATLAQTQSRNGKTNQARTSYQAAVAAVSEIEAPNHVYNRTNAANVYTSYAEFLRKTGRVGEALVLQNKAAQLLKGDAQHP